MEVSHRALHLLTLLDEAVTETLSPCKEKDIDSLPEGRAAETRNSVDIIFGENTTFQTQPPQKNIRGGELIGNAEQLGAPSHLSQSVRATITEIAQTRGLINHRNLFLTALGWGAAHD